MPSKGVEERSKRKREEKTLQPKKKSRSAPEDEPMEEEDQSAKILSMEQGILESRKNYNDIRTLLELSTQDDEAGMLATVALCRVFMRLLAQGSLNVKKNASEKDKSVTTWLKGCFSELKQHLTAMLEDEDAAATGLTLSMRLLKTEGEHLDTGTGDRFPHDYILMIIEAILASDDDEVLKAFIEEFAEQYDDIRFYTFYAVKSVIESQSRTDAPKTLLFDKAFTLISSLDGVPETSEELEDFYVPAPEKKGHKLLSINKHKKEAQDAWLALMGLAEKDDQKKRILDIISTVIAPWFTTPERLADFLTASYDRGGSMSLLALSGVFYLIQERNLDYPSFYDKLYSLLDRDLLHSKHRSRFFRLCDTFLASTHLPAALVASFIKRLARLALNAPPSAIVVLIPFFYNLLKRHPLCTFMMHRETRDPEVKKQIQEQGASEPFSMEETDTLKTGAIDSSLWEIVQLQSHYHPNVATIAKIISEQFTKQSYNVEDFLDHSYASLLDAELGKEVKKTPVVEFQIPKRVFLPQDDPAAGTEKLISRLWNFGGSSSEVSA